MAEFTVEDFKRVHRDRMGDAGMYRPGDEKIILAALSKEAERNSARLRSLRRLCGYIEDGSSQSVTIGQDDATKTWVLRAGNASYWANSFEQVIDAATDAALTKEDK